MEQLAQLIKDAVDQVGDDDEISFYNGYGGRGMYGRKCVGVVGSERACLGIVGAVIKSMSSSLSALGITFGKEGTGEAQDKLAAWESEFENAVDILMDSSRDSMGRSDIILYWEQLDELPVEQQEPNDGQPDEAQEWHDFDPDC